MPEEVLEPGHVLADKYRIERPVGRGGMGSVFSVIHLLTGKRLALKCLLPQHRSDPDSIERFMREARAVGRIQHRHVIDVFDVGSSAGVPFIVMPLLDGQSLDELLKDQTVTLEQVLVILIRAMAGVQAAHDIGIVHRDLKPSNIFVCVGISGRLDEPRVLDFGISKVSDESEARLTRSGAVVGTPYYMALEQITGRRDVDHRADVYAMGVILYEAIAGKPPHVAENAAALAIELMHCQPRPLDDLRSDLPPGLSEVVIRALARDREQRYQTMSEFIAALTPFVAAGALLQPAEAQGPKLRTPNAEHAEPANEATRGKTTTPELLRPQSSTAYNETVPNTTPEASLSRPRGTRLIIAATGVLVAAWIAWLMSPASPRPLEQPARPAPARAALGSPVPAAPAPTLAAPAHEEQQRPSAPQLSDAAPAPGIKAAARARAHKGKASAEQTPAPATPARTTQTPPAEQAPVPAQQKPAAPNELSPEQF